MLKDNKKHGYELIRKDLIRLKNSDILSSTRRGFFSRIQRSEGSTMDVRREVSIML